MTNAHVRRGPAAYLVRATELQQTLNSQESDVNVPPDSPGANVTYDFDNRFAEKCQTSSGSRV